jgi:hypothetical protein
MQCLFRMPIEYHPDDANAKCAICFGTWFHRNTSKAVYSSYFLKKVDLS